MEFKYASINSSSLSNGQKLRYFICVRVIPPLLLAIVDSLRYVEEKFPPDRNRKAKFALYIFRSQPSEEKSSHVRLCLLRLYECLEYDE